MITRTQAEKIDSFAQLRKGASIPVPSGEQIQGRWEVYDYLKEGALSVVQCDPEWCGALLVFVGPWLLGYLKNIAGRYDLGLWALAGSLGRSEPAAPNVPWNDNEKET